MSVTSDKFDELSKELVATILLINDHNHDSFWYRRHDHPEDIPAQVQKLKDNASEKEKKCHHNMLTSSIKHENLSLRKQLGVNQDA